MPISVLFNVGTNQWLCPVDITEVLVELWAGGGKGGNVTAAGGAMGAGGAGGGAYSALLYYPVIPGTLYTYSVGAGATSVSAGGSSWWVSTLVGLARGGLSVPFNTQAGSAGGLASEGVGDLKYSGGTGASGGNSLVFPVGLYGGGGGGAGHFLGPGGVGYLISGGSSKAGTGGVGRSQGSGQGNGGAGGAPGGGGGGALRLTSGTRAGGNGYNGRIHVSYSNAWFKHLLSEEDRAAEEALEIRLDSIRFEVRRSLIGVQTRETDLPPENRVKNFAPESRLTLIDSEDRTAGSGQ